MRTDSLIPRTRSRRRTLGRILASASMAMALATSLPSAAIAADDAEVENGTRIADRAYPGIQMVLNSYRGKVTVPVLGVNQSALQSLVYRLQAQVLTGVIAANERAIQAAIVKEFINHPIKYFVPTGRNRTTTGKVGTLGTGFVVTPNGYMITAAHTVKMTDSELASAMAGDALDKFARADLRGLSNDNGLKISRAQRIKLAKAMSRYNARYLRLSDVSQNLEVRLGVAGSGAGKTGQLVAAEVIDSGSSYPDKDFAIIKVDGHTNLPTIPVGDDGTIVAGSKFYVAGFTGASTFFPGASEDAINTPAVTEGPVTAVKSNDRGVPYFQTQAPAGPGNSGGPVLDEQGRAVGILVAGSRDSSTGEMVQGQQWVLPMSVVKDSLNEHNVKPSSSTTTKIYDEALEDYYQHYYERALPKFQKAARLYPGHPFAQSFITKSETAITNGQDETPWPMWVWALIGLAVLLLVGGVLGTLLLLRRKRSKAGSQTLAAPAAVPVGAGVGAAPAQNGFAPPQTPGGQPGYAAPVQQAPVQQAPVQQPPVQQPPVQQPPVQQPPVQQAPVQQAPVQQAPVQQAPVQQAPAGGTGFGEPGQHPVPSQPAPVPPADRPVAGEPTGSEPGGDAPQAQPVLPEEPKAPEPPASPGVW